MNEKFIQSIKKQFSDSANLLADFGDKHEIYQFTVNQKVNDHWTATYILERDHRSFDFLEGEFNDYKLEGELAFESEFFAAYTWETTSDPFAQETGWRIWEFKWRPDSKQELNLVTGARRDGIVCSGGVCRNEPAFDGYRIDYLVRF